MGPTARRGSRTRCSRSRHVGDDRRPLQPGAIALLAGDTIVISAVTETHEWRIAFTMRDVAVLGAELKRLTGSRS